jgi:hypothetical protein
MTRIVQISEIRLREPFSMEAPYRGDADDRAFRLPRRAN